MTVLTSRRHTLALAGATLLAPVLPARAQTKLPAGPLRMLVGYAAGGTTDVLARLIAAKLQERTGRTVIVENKPGSGGVIATEAAAKSTPDGATFVLAGMTSTAVGKLTFPNLPYDPEKDLAPISLASTFQLALALNPKAPVETVPQFIAWAKANPKLANFGVPGLGGLSHFFGVMLGKAIGVPMEAVPYKGAAPMLNDLASGQIQVGVSALSDFVAPHKSGTVKILATTGVERSLSTPDLPTFAEAGYKDLTGVGWLAYYAPAKAPREVVGALSAEISAILALPEIRERVASMGMEPRASTPEELAAFDLTEGKRWEPVVAEAGFKVN